jgi:hypothetical protein
MKQGIRVRRRLAIDIIIETALISAAESRDSQQ